MFAGAFQFLSFIICLNGPGFPSDDVGLLDAAISLSRAVHLRQEAILIFDHSSDKMLLCVTAAEISGDFLIESKSAQLMCFSEMSRLAAKNNSFHGLVEIGSVIDVGQVISVFIIDHPELPRSFNFFALRDMILRSIKHPKKVLDDRFPRLNP